jgi:hypothetical protein
MAEKMENQKKFSTCLEDTPFAEMMQRMIGLQGIGSLCSEMMRKVLEKQGDGGSFHCDEMMRSMMKKCGGNQEKHKEVKEEEGHVRNQR